MAPLYHGWALSKAQANLANAWAYLTGNAALPSLRATANLPAYIANNSVYNVKDFGATGDGVADDTAFIQAAINAVVAAGKGRVVFPPGRFKHSANLTVTFNSATACSMSIEGAPYGGTTLLPAAAVTRAIDINFTGGDASQDDRIRVSGLHVDGVSTTGATGIAVGRLTQTNHCVFEDVEVRRFAGSGGKGVDLGLVVGAFFTNCRFTRCATNLYVDCATSSMPTWLVFNQCWFYLATGRGVDIRQGYRITFSDCTIESNGAEGVYVVPAAVKNVLDLSVVRCWFESNGGVASVRVDGTGAGTISPKIRNSYFAGVTPGIYLKNCANFLIDDPSLLTGMAVGYITVDGGTGQITNWPHNNADIRTVLSVLNGARVSMIEAASTDRLQWDISGSTSQPILKPLISGAAGGGLGLNLGTDTLRFGQIFGTQFHGYIGQPMWGASVTPDPSHAICQIIASSATAWTLNAPSGGGFGTRIQITVRNSSGGAMGAATIAAGYRQTGYSNPANGSETTASFYYDTTAWRQCSPWVTTTV